MASVLGAGLVVGVVAGAVAGGVAVLALHLIAGLPLTKAQFYAIAHARGVVRPLTDATFYGVFLWAMWRHTVRRFDDGRARFFAWPGVKTVLAGVACGAGVLCLVGLPASVVMSSGHPSRVLHLSFVVPHDPLQFLYVFAVIALLGPPVEEFFYRGYVLGWLRQKMPAAGATVLCAAFFALMHFRLFQYSSLSMGALASLPVFALGLVTAWLTLKTKSLWPGIAAHAVNNGLALFAACILQH